MQFKNKVSQKRAKNIFALFSWLFVALLVGWMIWGILCCVGNLNDNVYPFNQADSKFDRAIGTNSLLTFAEYTEEGLFILDGYSGNEEWFLPTDRTNMDLIKLDIQIIINNSILAANMTTYGSDAYQEALDNAKESLDVQTERLARVELLYLGGGKSYIAPFWIWVGVFIATIVLLCIFGCIWDDLNCYNHYSY